MLGVPIMDGIAIKGRITPDHKVEGDAPANMPPGEIDILLLPRAVNGTGNPKQIAAFIGKLAATGIKGRTKEEIDRDLEIERASWE